MTTSTTTSPLLARPGAVEGRRRRRGGRPLRRPARAATPRRGPGRRRPVAPRVVTVTGPDRLTWLHSMTTQQLTGLAPRGLASRSSCRPRATSSTPCTSSTTGRRRGSRSSPGRHRPRRLAGLDALHAAGRGRRRHRRVCRPRRADRRRVGDGRPLAWVDPWPRLVGDAVAIQTGEGHPGDGRLARAASAARRPGGRGRRPPAGWHLGGRGAAGRRVAPPVGHETDHRTIPHEVDWLRTAVHLHKGCYRGRRRSPGSTTSAGRRGGSSSCTSTVGTPLPEDGRTARRPRGRAVRRWPGTTRTVRSRWP